jgi:SAM-dependent methyltransferase
MPPWKRFRRRVKSAYFRVPGLYHLYLTLKFGAARMPPLERPELPNAVLQSAAQLREATEFGKRYHLPRHRAEEKNWDHLAAVRAILSSTSPTACVLDAGAEMYSNVLPALFACGYRRLYGMNLSFADPARRGAIRYLRGDITRTGFSDGFFDAVTCMSVVEHGVPLPAYFAEMFRVLRPGGVLITSTDYYPEPVDTAGKEAYGAPIRIFCRKQADEMLAQARECGFELTGPVDLAPPALRAGARPIQWQEYGLEFTFLIFTLRKPAKAV